MITGSVAIRSYAGDVQRHSHAHHQIVLPRHGRLALEVDGREGAVVAGIGACIVAGAPHEFHARGANAFVVLDVPAEREAQSDPVLAFAGAAFFPVTRAMQALLDYLAAAPSGRPQHAAWTTLLLASLAQCQDLAANRRGPDRIDAALGRAMAFMRDRLAEGIHVVDIAAAAGLSETRLHAAFRARLGKTPHAALTALRLDAARHLLSGTGLSIAEIAARTGHADQSALTRRLRLTDGVTPAALRRAVRPMH